MAQSTPSSIQELMDKKQKEATLDMGGNFTKRDDLIRYEKEAQEKWANSNIFQTDSPYIENPELKDLSGEELREKYPKFFGTFPYPYMNGSLHLGHAFTISKIEFAVGFERMRGRRALFPVGWHATGMPIKSASDKIIRELEQFGQDLSKFDSQSNPMIETNEDKSATEPTTASESQDKSKAKKGKIQAKSTGLQYQFQIMESIGVSRTDIPKFADPQYWLQYFPPIAKNDLNAFGARVDWRRSFITTDINPYYDAFVRWQMNRLKEKGYVKFGERYTIYSPKDGQPCMDHDRSSGERLGSQEYTCLKMKVLEWGPQAGDLATKLGGKDVFFVAATLRPETMYGQTNCFVGPNIEYGLFEMKDGSLYICTARAARNMAFQNLTVERGVVNQVASVQGSALYGTKIHAPNAIHQAVYILPMETVLATKGTGVVTSVPSDSPDDYINLMHLRKKAAYYGLDPAWVSLDPIPVLSTPEFGEMSAPKLVSTLKIDSPKDAAKLAEAKERAYKAGFYQGIMSVGPFAGEPVEKAKPKVREELIKQGCAFAYAEPEGQIISRSNDECVVALCDQWYLDYGEPTWQAKAFKLLERMQIRDGATKKKFQEDLDWLHQWACARSYGLGSRLPWDPQFLVESLSDSTIYMAYYTLSHLLHGGDIFGKTTGPLGVTPDQMTDQMWDYIFGTDQITFKADPIQDPLSKDKADLLRREFRYFYPMDVRSSGKDLISNHLCFCIYVHTALFDEQFWPRTMRANGHLMLNGKKMSKSTGNSLTLCDSLKKFGADATRLTLADSGDGFDDANFEELTANASILRLHTLLEWCREVISNNSDFRTGPFTLFDQIFENETKLAINKTYKAYDESCYKEAQKVGFYELLGARDWYRDFTSEEGGMHGELLRNYVRTQALLIAPIAPHFAEYVWGTILGESGSIQNASFPEGNQSVDQSMIDAAEYVKETVRSVRTTEINLAKRKAKAKGVQLSFDPSKPKRLRIFVADTFPAWQSSCIDALQKNLDPLTTSIDEKSLRADLEKMGLFKDKRTMPFIMMMKGKLKTHGKSALERSLTFEENEILTKAMGYLKRTLNYEEVEIESLGSGLAHLEKLEHEHSSAGTPNAGFGQFGYNRAIIEASQPGSPAFVVYNSPV
ncbi:cytosolic leucyl tRNA synthetase [Puccinia graminis f. sp. tritici]|uniref:leucine--tRNA ligase n=1 Tax=Puccinia graminis f. sp. tritici TaxID=56615 RepID=A0A5B0RLF6_PUCGR|nr:cytosolic leucyl tRNA synthetase [Puccinia graminis f. sp. tritici]KAA1125773.1 cytosolic leucyl tRNA synthetase [Puccinia graminis f. sp. tritici]